MSDYQREVERAEQNCIKTFPPRFREARTSHKEILLWVDIFLEATVGSRIGGVAVPSPNLGIIGPVGTGKTHHAFGALRLIATSPQEFAEGAWRGVPTRHISHPEFLALIRPRPEVRDHSPEAELAKLVRIPLLLLDDLGAAKDSPAAEEATYRLLSGRYDAALPTIFTTNLPPAVWADRFGERVSSRLRQELTLVALTGADRRVQT